MIDYATAPETPMDIRLELQKAYLREPYEKFFEEDVKEKKTRRILKIKMVKAVMRAIKMKALATREGDEDKDKEGKNKKKKRMAVERKKEKEERKIRKIISRKNMKNGRKIIRSRCR